MNRKKIKMRRNEDNVRDLWDNIKHANIHLVWGPKEKREKKWPEKIVEELKMKISLN